MNRFKPSDSQDDIMAEIARIQALVRRFQEMPAGVPGHLTDAEVVRCMQIAQAEYDRHQAHLALMDFMDEAKRRYQSAETADAAVDRTGYKKEVARLQASIAMPDEAGLRWYVQQVERSLAEGTFIVLPPD